MDIFSDMTDAEAAMLHNLLAKYVSADTYLDDWSIAERDTIRALADDLSESICDTRIALVAWPTIPGSESRR